MFFVGAAGAGESVYTTPGTYTWICPDGVTSVSVVCVGGGGRGGQGQSPGTYGGGGGGGLGYKNNITVIPGNSYTVVVGAGGVGPLFGGQSGSPGQDSYFINTMTVKGGGGQGTLSDTGAPGGTYTGDGGGNGGNGGNGTSLYGGGAGGGGGYAGAGGSGGNGAANAGTAGANGSGGGGGGGGGGGWVGFNNGGGRGGGVGIFGQGANGTGGSGGFTGENPGAGQPGSGGLSISYGGGVSAASNALAGDGAVRIIWAAAGGPARSFPSTNVS
jgi:hypothetical protein